MAGASFYRDRRHNKSLLTLRGRVGRPIGQPIVSQVDVILHPTSKRALRRVVPFIRLNTRISVNHNLTIVSRTDLSSRCQRTASPQSLFIGLGPTNRATDRLLLATKGFTRSRAQTGCLLFLTKCHTRLTKHNRRDALSLNDLATNIPMISNRYFSSRFVRSRLNGGPNTVASVRVSSHIGVINARRACLAIIFGLPALGSTRPLVTRLSCNRGTLNARTIIFNLAANGLVRSRPYRRWSPSPYY